MKFTKKKFYTVSIQFITLLYAMFPSKNPRTEFFDGNIPYELDGNYVEIFFVNFINKVFFFLNLS